MTATLVAAQALATARTWLRLARRSDRDVPEVRTCVRRTSANILSGGPDQAELIHRSQAVVQTDLFSDLSIHDL